MRIPPVVLIVVACGGSSGKPQDPAKAAADARRKQLESEKPRKPFEVRERHAFRPPERCGQGPYRIELPSLRAKFGEELRVYACGAHDVAGNYRYSVQEDGKQPRVVTEAAFGWGDRDNAGCKADRAPADLGGAGTIAVDDSGVAPTRGVADRAPGSSGAASRAGSPGARPAVAAGQGASLATVDLERVTDIPSSCSARVEILNMTHTAAGEFIPVEGRMMLDVWSETPNDYEDMVFVVEQLAVESTLTADAWKAYREADEAWNRRYSAFLTGEIDSGRVTLVDSKVTAPPPPPPIAEVKPPKPSKNARWLTGYWHYEASQFHWIAGLWEVPEADIQQDLTVVAPTPPPAEPPPVETRPAEPQPTATAVWTPGQWQWDGRAYVWIRGAWRIPPSAASTWQPARWNVRGRGAIYVPGRWSIRIGR